MATVPSLRIDKQFTFRGAPEIFSSRYHFVGGVPADNAHWHTLALAVITAEKAVMSSRCTIVKAVGRVNDDVGTPSIYTEDFSTACTFATGGFPFAPGDCAALLSWATLQRDTRGHIIHCHAYYHDVYMSAVAGSDAIVPGQKVALETYGTAWIAPGFSDGTNTYQRSTPDGHLCVSRSVNQWIGRRKLKRRG